MPWLRVGWGLLMIISCCPLVTAAFIRMIAENEGESEGGILCLSHLKLNLCFWICMSVSIRCSLLVLSAFWHSIKMHFVICLDICQHSKHCDNPSASGFIHLAGLQYFDCGKCMCVCVFLYVCQPLC